MFAYHSLASKKMYMYVCLNNMTLVLLHVFELDVNGIILYAL